jgi:hypothetical protein
MPHATNAVATWPARYIPQHALPAIYLSGSSRQGRSFGDYGRQGEPSVAGTTTSPSMIAEPAGMCQASSTFFETIGPVMAAACENLHRFVGEMHPSARPTAPFRSMGRRFFPVTVVSALAITKNGLNRRGSTLGPHVRTTFADQPDVRSLLHVCLPCPGRGGIARVMRCAMLHVNVAGQQEYGG